MPSISLHAYNSNFSKKYMCCIGARIKHSVDYPLEDDKGKLIAVGSKKFGKAHSTFLKAVEDFFPCLCMNSLIYTRGELGEFETLSIILPAP